MKATLISGICVVFMGFCSRMGKREKVWKEFERPGVRARQVNDRIRSGSPAQQVFLIFTVVPQFFGSQNAKKRKTAEKLPTATASRPDAMGPVRWTATEGSRFADRGLSESSKI